MYPLLIENESENKIQNHDTSIVLIHQAENIAV